MNSEIITCIICDYLQQNDAMNYLDSKELINDYKYLYHSYIDDWWQNNKKKVRYLSHVTSLQNINECINLNGIHFGNIKEDITKHMLPKNICYVSFNESYHIVINKDMFPDTLHTLSNVYKYDVLPKYLHTLTCGYIYDNPKPLPKKLHTLHVPYIDLGFKYPKSLKILKVRVPPSEEHHIPKMIEELHVSRECSNKQWLRVICKNIKLDFY